MTDLLVAVHFTIYLLHSLVNHGTVQTLCAEMATCHMGSVSAVVLRDVLCLYESVAELLTACSVQDTNFRLELLGNTTGLKSLTTLLLLQWQGILHVDTR